MGILPGPTELSEQEMSQIQILIKTTVKFFRPSRGSPIRLHKSLLRRRPWGEHGGAPTLSFLWPVAVLNN